MTTGTSAFSRSISLLESAYARLLNQTTPHDEDDIYRAACIKYFELAVNLSLQLLNNHRETHQRGLIVLSSFSAHDTYRFAANFGGPIPLTAAKRWINYYHIRSHTINHYQPEYVEQAFQVLPRFIKDAKQLAQALNATL